MVQYSNLAKYFSMARRYLMLPHPKGEEESIMVALAECNHGLRDLDRQSLDGHVRELIKKLEKIMNTDNIKSSTGKWRIKAKELSLIEKQELSEIIDDLANYFTRLAFNKT